MVRKTGLRPIFCEESNYNPSPLGWDIYWNINVRRGVVKNEDKSQKRSKKYFEKVLTKTGPGDIVYMQVSTRHR